MLKHIDNYFFGTQEEQEGTNKFDKLYFYLSMGASLAVTLYITIF